MTSGETGRGEMPTKLKGVSVKANGVKLPPVRTPLFDGPAALMDHVQGTPRLWQRFRSEETDEGSRAFTGTATWEEAVRLARYGWPDGIRHLSGGLDLRIAGSHDPVPEFHYDYAGAFPEVPRAVSGDPESMVTILPSRRTRRPVLRIAVSMIAPATVPPGRITSWGAALVGWIDELEAQNVRAEITWISVSDNTWWSHDGTEGPMFVATMRLKEADQPLDIDRIAFWLMHPAAHRRIQLALKERYDIEDWYLDEYGRAVSDTGVIAGFLDQDAIVLSVGDGAATVEAGKTLIAGRVQAALDGMVEG
jgi:hypothetical protein